MIRAVFTLLLCAFALPAAAQIDSAPKVHASLIAEGGEVAPGGTLAIALEENIRPTWHTYWVNPGEAGFPTDIKWSLPPGWKAGAIQWPYPKRLPVGPLMNYGYEGKVWLLTSVTAPANAAQGLVTLKADASWLVCQEVCIPEEQVLTLLAAVSPSPVVPYATVKDAFDAARAKIPTPSPWPVVFSSGPDLDLFVASQSLAKAQLKEVTFYPKSEGVIAGMAAQRLGIADSGIVLRLTPAKGAKSPKTLDGVVVLTSADGSVQSLDVDAKPGAVPSARFAGGEESGLWLSLLFAFIGGLILNLMPCVLPILAIKALALAKVAHGDRGEATREGFAYGIGAILSFAALGGLLVALRTGGQAIGWGFQLQEPAAVAGFALLVFAVGLNLSGVFVFSGGITAGDALTRRGGWVGSFFTGILAVAVAAPCTAPFMAAALGYALTQSAIIAIAVFLALGLGFALPFVLVGSLPGLLRVLPKPGAWMLTFKQLLAFPMYAAAVWLVWVLTQETATTALIAILGGMILLAFAAWAWTVSRDSGAGWRATGAIFAALGLLGALASLVFIRGDAVSPPATANSETAGIPSEPYTAAKLADLRAQKRGVFVDATAAWCITCIVNEKVALANDRVRGTFAQKHIAYLIADWTSRNAQITALLQANGRSGVPLYLYYAPGAANPIVLPQILTQGEVVQVIGQ